MTGLIAANHIQWFSGFFSIEALNTFQRKQRFLWGEAKPFFFPSVTFLGSLIDHYPLGLTNCRLKTTAVNTHTNHAGALMLFVGCRSFRICLSGLRAFQVRNCHFLCIMLNTAKTWFQVTILEPQQWITMMNEHSDCHLVSEKIPPQKPSKSDTWLQWGREGGEWSFASHFWLSHLLIFATILLVR